MIMNLEIQGTNYSGITTTIFSTKWIYLDFKQMKRPLNYHNFLTNNSFSRVITNCRLDYVYKILGSKGSDNQLWVICLSIDYWL